MSRPRITLSGLVWAAFAALAVVAFSVPATARSQDEAAVVRAASKRRPPLMVVRTIGEVSDAQARQACRALLAQLPVRCELRASRSVVDLGDALDEKRGQLDARIALDLLFRDRSADALVEINLTSVDIFEPGKPFVFGLASLSDRVALISTARLRDDDPTLFADRVTKLVMHEGGHTFGLHHHEHEDCVMRQDPSVASLDDAPTTPCVRCRKRLERRARLLARPGQLALDRARGFLARDESATARQLLLGTVWAGEYEDALLHDFGVAFQSAGELDDAIGIYKFLIEESPKHARGHVSLGITYQSRGSDGDVERAIRHFERALELRPDWTTVAAHLEGLQTVTRPRAQGPSATR
ncbi:MAG: hypothetical protein AAGA54_34000 [Myxococcota bacterium]